MPKTIVRKDAKIAFKKRHANMFRRCNNGARGMRTKIAELARAELGYSKNTCVSDIYTTLNKRL